MKECMWDVINSTRMGQYLTYIEMGFIDQCLQQDKNVQYILDVGGGSGRFAIPLEKKGYKVMVTEVSSLPLLWLKSRSPQTDAILTSPHVWGWPIKDSSVDCVLAIELPIIASHWFWIECHRVLKPNGFVIALSNNRSSYKGILYKTRFLFRPFLTKRGKDWADRHFYSHSARTVCEIFKENCFELDMAQGCNWLPVGRSSESRLIPLFSAIEQRLGLRRHIFQSPWVLFSAKRV